MNSVIQQIIQEASDSALLNLDEKTFLQIANRFTEEAFVALERICREHDLNLNTPSELPAHLADDEPGSQSTHFD